MSDTKPGLMETVEEWVYCRTHDEPKFGGDHELRYIATAQREKTIRHLENLNTLEANAILEEVPEWLYANNKSDVVPKCGTVDALERVKAIRDRNIGAQRLAALAPVQTKS